MFEFVDTIRRTYNRIRLWVLSVFTNRIKSVEITDPKTKKKHKVTIEKQMEKVCTHDRIVEVAPTLWKCDKCTDAYFIINYKAMANQQEIIEYLEKAAKVVGKDLNVMLEDNASEEDENISEESESKES